MAHATSRWSYSLSARSQAPASVVWPLVAEVDRWREWSFVTRSYLLRDGSPAPDGVGALRRLAVGPVGSSEEVVVFEPGVHLGYEARKGLPVRSYRADVVLSAVGTGTSIAWSGSLEPLVPGTGGLVLAYARGFVRTFLRQLVRYADDRTGSGSTG
jgi:hypothetical protein